MQWMYREYLDLGFDDLMFTIFKKQTRSFALIALQSSVSRSGGHVGNQILFPHLKFEGEELIPSAGEFRQGHLRQIGVVVRDSFGWSSNESLTVFMAWWLVGCYLGAASRDACWRLLPQDTSPRRIAFQPVAIGLVWVREKRKERLNGYDVGDTVYVDLRICARAGSGHLWCSMKSAWLSWRDVLMAYV